MISYVSGSSKYFIRISLITIDFGIIILLILQMKKMRHREEKWLSKHS